MARHPRLQRAPEERALQRDGFVVPMETDDGTLVTVALFPTAGCGKPHAGGVEGSRGAIPAPHPILIAGSRFPAPRSPRGPVPTWHGLRHRKVMFRRLLPAGCRRPMC